MLMGHPCGNGIRGRAENDFDAGLAHGVHHAVHPRVFELAVFGLPQAPGGLAHADHVEAGIMHEGNVFVQAFVGHVLVVVGRAVEDGGEIKSGAAGDFWPVCCALAATPVSRAAVASSANKFLFVSRIIGPLSG